MRIVLEVLRDHQLYAKFSKYKFLLTGAKFLGHILSAPSVSEGHEKIEQL